MGRVGVNGMNAPGKDDVDDGVEGWLAKQSKATSG